MCAATQVVFGKKKTKNKKQRHKDTSKPGREYKQIDALQLFFTSFSI